MEYAFKKNKNELVVNKSAPIPVVLQYVITETDNYFFTLFQTIYIYIYIWNRDGLNHNWLQVKVSKLDY